MPFYPSRIDSMITSKIHPCFLQFHLIILCLSHVVSCLETHTITTNLVLKDPDSIVSQGKVFRLGFFSPPNTTNRYLGIMYNISAKTVMWVANRDNPLTDSSGTVTISKDGNIVLMNSTNQIVWSSNATTHRTNNTSAQLLDTGNLVLRDNSTGNILWESLENPSHVFVPTMRIFDNVNTGRKVLVSSWKNPVDPEMGSFTSGLEAAKIPQMFVWDQANRPHWRSGPWNGQILLGVQDMYSVYLDGFSVVNNHNGSFYFTAPPGKFLMRITLNSTGSLEQTLWNDQTENWDVTWIAPQNECDVYGKCGPFGVCSAKDSPVCSCLKGFQPKDKETWERGDWSGGCVRRKALQCNGNSTDESKEDGFLRLQFMKVPDFTEPGPSGTELECRALCLRNCTCIAYAHDSSLGCMFWNGTLIDITQFSGVGADLYVRLASSELDQHKHGKLVIIIPVVAGSVAILFFGVIVWCLIPKRTGAKIRDRKLFEAGQSGQTYPSISAEIVLKDDTETINLEEFPLFKFESIANATDQFHHHNLLGKGGFGPVYKGTLANGKEIAVKRLSATSGQGLEEFMNEVKVISKVQHRNLVRLLGCCVENEEKILIYEYMSNKSLDVFLFDPTHPSQKILDWMKRSSIIEGIGRGLLYLHRDSRLTIIHRDLKPSNVLLDEDWNPKISDFGMARIFGGNQDQANTGTVVGTYGYMAPEFAMDGRFSEKSDVYSFGVLMLEIISGKKTTVFYNHELSLSLLGFAWKLWNEDNGLALVDPTIASAEFQDEIVRCIHIALLCVQEFPENRPTISTVLSMLSRELVDLPIPEQPIFFEKWSRFHVGSSQQSQASIYSVNDVTITMLVGR